MSAVYIHAPQPTETRAVANQNCPARGRDGRRCGGRRMVVSFTPWYGISAKCYHCGARYGEDGCQLTGRADVGRVRSEWLSLMSDTDPTDRDGCEWDPR